MATTYRIRDVRFSSQQLSRIASSTTLNVPQMHATVSSEPPPPPCLPPRVPLRASKLHRSTGSLHHRPRPIGTSRSPLHSAQTSGCTSLDLLPATASQFSPKLPGRGLKSTKSFATMPHYISRRWLLIVSLFIGVSLATKHPGARPLINNVGTDGLADELEQVHVSLAGSTYMKVTWITSRSSSGIPSVVEYGTSPGNYTGTANGTTGSYWFLLYRSGTIHNALVGPLKSDTTYYYKCSRIGKEYSFKTPPAELPLLFAIVGDIGQTENTVSTLDHVIKSNYDVLLFAGDLSYADYNQPRWDSFGRLVEASASTRPWMVTEGNHEIERVPLLVDSFKAYNNRWRMPFELSGSSSNLYYSFEVAGSHVVMLGSYADYGVDSEQYKWLQADLAKVDRNRTPWLIVVLHAPWYNSNSAHQGEGDDMMDVMEPLLRAARADILFCGHVHAYERWARMYNGKEDPCGIVHITVGDGGNREGLAKTFLDPQPAGSLFREASFGHGRLNVFNSTHAHWSWHRNDDSEDVVGDEVWITSLSGGCQAQSSEPRIKGS